MFTPGDNDWTDCDRNPGVSSAERLAFERRILFSTPFSLGRHAMRQEVQDPPYVENRRWSAGGVVYATLNVQGSCNNLCDTAPDPQEFAARNAADITWLKQTFDEARAKHAVAVMLIFQADPGWDGTDGTRAPTRDPQTLAETDKDPATGQPIPDGYEAFLTELRTQTVAFGRPVAAVHGDSHYFRVDKPLLDPTGRRVQKTSPGSRPSATTRRTTTTTSNGCGSTSTRARARCSPTSRRSSPPTLRRDRPDRPRAAACRARQGRVGCGCNCPRTDCSWISDAFSFA